MSDFGATIILTKKGELSLTTSDHELVSQEIEKIRSENEFLDALGENFIFIISEGIGKEFTNIIIILSEYWYSGERDEKESFEFAKDNDWEQVEYIAEKLKSSLGQIFEIKGSFESW
jgi:hypothetical protein